MDTTHEHSPAPPLVFRSCIDDDGYRGGAGFCSLPRITSQYCQGGTGCLLCSPAEGGARSPPSAVGISSTVKKNKE